MKRLLPFLITFTIITATMSFGVYADSSLSALSSKVDIFSYREPMSVSVDDSNNVLPVKELRVNFGDALSTSTITKNMFDIDNAVITGVSYENGDKTCVLKLDTPLLREKNYILRMTDGIRSVNGLIPAVDFINFKTSALGGYTTVTEDNNNFENIYEKSSGVTCGNFWNDAGNPDPMMFGVGLGETPSYVVYYNNDNTLYSFSFDTLTYGTRTGDYTFKVSEDGVNYTTLTNGTDYTYKWLQEDALFPSIMNNSGGSFANLRQFYSKSIPANTKYLKIEFPQIASDGLVKQATIGDGELVWSVDDEARVVDNNAHPVSNKINIIFNKSINSSTVDTSSFTVDGYKVSGVNVKDNMCTVTLNKNLTPASMNTITISEDVNTEFGNSISADYRKLGFYTIPSIEEDYGNWQSVKIGDGGMSTGFVVHPMDPDLVYLRTDVGGIYRWDADARYWQPLTEFSEDDIDFLHAGHSIAVDPKDPDVVYAALGYQWYKKGGVYKSNDRGTTWEKTSLSVSFAANSNGRKGSGESLVVDPEDNNIIYCGTPYNGMYISRDKGDSWDKVEDIPDGYTITESNKEDELIHEGVRTVAVDESTGYVYAGVHEYGVYVSYDKGYNWELIEDGPIRPSCIYAIDGVLYVTNGIGDIANVVNTGLYTYKDGLWDDIAPSGTTGSTRATVAKNDNGEVVIAVFGDKSDDTAHKMWVKVGNGNWELMTPESKTDKSREDISEFLPWTGENISIFGYSITAMKLTGANNCGELWLATGKGVYHIENLFDTTEKYVAETNGIELLCVNNVKAPPSGDAKLFVTAWDYGPFRLTDTQDYQQAVALGYVSGATGWYNMGMGLAYCETDPDYVVRASMNNNDFMNTIIATSAQNGTYGTWSIGGWQQNSNYSGGAVAVSSGKNSNGVPDVVALTNLDGTTVAKYSEDFGTTWKDVTGLPTYMMLGNGNMITADKVANGTFYVYDGTNGGLYISTDGGKTFELAGEVSPYGGTAVAHIVVVSSPDNAGEILVGAGTNGMYRSYDGGKSFEKAEEVTKVIGIDYGKNAPNRSNSTVFVLGVINDVYGLFRSDDGVNYVKINDSERQALGWAPSAISADRRTYGKVYVANGSGRGVYEFGLASETPETYISADEQSAYVYENKFLDEKLVLYAAVYNADNTLKSVKISKPKFIDKFGKLNVETEQLGTGEYVRYFLWGESSLTPLVDFAFN